MDTRYAAGPIKQKYYGGDVVAASDPAVEGDVVKSELDAEISVLFAELEIFEKHLYGIEEKLVRVIRPDYDEAEDTGETVKEIELVPAASDIRNARKYLRRNNDRLLKIIRRLAV